MDEDVGMAYEDMQASTFIEYKPAKLAHLKCLKPHTDPVTETSTLAATPLPELTYKIHLPKSTILDGKLSSLQLETIMYACQQVDFLLFVQFIFKVCYASFGAYFRSAECVSFAFGWRDFV
jgi:hypothetical protein